MKKILVGAGIAIAGILGIGAALGSDTKPDVARGTSEQILQNEESLFAEIDPTTGEVVRVIVISADLLNTGKWGDPKNFVRTYPDGRVRGNRADVGYTYRADLDVFLPPRPYASWTLNEATAKWQPPSARPQDGKPYEWNERDQKWVTE